MASTESPPPPPDEPRGPTLAELFFVQAGGAIVALLMLRGPFDREAAESSWVDTYQFLRSVLFGIAFGVVVALWWRSLTFPRKFRPLEWLLLLQASMVNVMVALLPLALIASEEEWFLERGFRWLVEFFVFVSQYSIALAVIMPTVVMYLMLRGFWALLPWRVLRVPLALQAAACLMAFYASASMLLPGQRIIVLPPPTTLVPFDPAAALHDGVVALIYYSLCALPIALAWCDRKAWPRTSWRWTEYSGLVLFAFGTLLLPLAALRAASRFSIAWWHYALPHLASLLLAVPLCWLAARLWRRRYPLAALPQAAVDLPAPEASPAA